MADHRDFAQRLKQACDRSPDVPALGKGQQTWLSDRLGISQEAVRRYFEGQSRPRPKLMTQLAKILNVDESWLALGKSADISDKERKQYSQKADAAAYMLFGIFMGAGYTCAFAEDGEEGVDFYAIRGGKQIGVSVTVGFQKTKSTYIATVRENAKKRLNLCVINIEPGVSDVLVMDEEGVAQYGEAKTDVIHVTVKKERQGYHTEGRIWTQLKESDIL
ncbi:MULTISPECIES: helix-turn-helix domain-containing protein [unclassified Marinobacter]|uniref:helix-turn-helix domain-containing protein n=1 Tax=unclassified Marinobacter TaxID=83889 RepID=UPI0012682935|nr:MULTISPECIES: helix-turn-helix transcriptional regulator [unclassified Marinobacter]QFS86594.1 Helix-turn-helix protein [Marinobacter sp. THAF197a]QFT50378.1 Helix-turn-helix protein [Marinobacter sp. THAF39]QFT52900.1 Helix-turn-helix protein [Marinobacter sp. THAF39]